MVNKIVKKNIFVLDKYRAKIKIEIIKNLFLQFEIIIKNKQGINKAVIKSAYTKFNETTKLYGLYKIIIRNINKYFTFNL